MSKYERHIFVCENQRDPGNPKGDCKSKGSTEIRNDIKKLMAEAGLHGRMRCNTAGCLDACEYGPAAVVYPEAVWYRISSAEDASEVVREHMVNGRVVERLRIDFTKKPAKS